MSDHGLPESMVYGAQNEIVEHDLGTIIHDIQTYVSDVETAYLNL